MAWNEPGGGNQDPWSGGGRDQGPPDLDEVVRKLQERLGGLFGGGGGTGGPGGSRGIGASVILIGVLVLALVWLALGFYIINPAERGLVLRFGAHSDTTLPGLHWHIPFPVEQVIRVDVEEISTFTHQATMLTQDENIVDVELTVQSRIADAADYTFQINDPNKTLRDATEAVVRKTIGGSKLDYILTEGREATGGKIKERIQVLMERYKTGLLVNSVNMQPAKPPEAVKAAFDDAIKAREDKERSENKAEAYANEILPRAGGEAARVVADAKAYRDKVIASAEGETARFLLVLAEYQKAPDVTRERLYLDAIEGVFAKNTKVILDAQDASSLMYLPIDQLLKQRADQATVPRQLSSPSDGGESSRLTPQRTVSRERRSR